MCRWVAPQRSRSPVAPSGRNNTPGDRNGAFLTAWSKKTAYWQRPVRKTAGRHSDTEEELYFLPSDSDKHNIEYYIDIDLLFYRPEIVLIIDAEETLSS